MIDSDIWTAVRDHNDQDQASHPDYLDTVEEELDKQKTLTEYASRLD